MATAINYSKSYKEQLFNDTQKEAKRMLSAGMEQLTKDEFLDKLKYLGFKLSLPECFHYINSANETTYKAFSIYIIDIERKISFAHFEFGISNEERQRLEALQKIRRDCFVYDYAKHCIWEL